MRACAWIALRGVLPQEAMPTTLVLPRVAVHPRVSADGQVCMCAVRHTPGPVAEEGPRAEGHPLEGATEVSPGANSMNTTTAGGKSIRLDRRLYFSFPALSQTG
jgi:hypothetical protein